MVSVIVPVYNVEKVMHYCINSILDQTNKKFELIIVDDGSIDYGGTVCDDYLQKNERIKVIHKRNGGVSSARNVGMDVATGEYFCFVDSDDYVDINYLDSLEFVKKQNPLIENIWCGFQTVDGYESSNKIYSILFSESEICSYVSRQKIMDLHSKWLDAGPVCKLYSSIIIHKHKLRFNEAISLGEDLLFNYQYLDMSTGIICVLNQKLYSYVTSSNHSLSQTFHPNLFESYCYIHQEIRYYLKKWGCTKEQISAFYNASFFIYDFVLRNTFHRDSNVKNKLKFNKNIMKSNEFQNTFFNTSWQFNPAYKFVYKHSFSFGYRLLIVLEKISNNIRNSKE